MIHAGGSEEQARQLVTGIYQRVAVLDSGARGAATTFAEEKVGDVRLTWENEAQREVAEGEAPGSSTIRAVRRAYALAGETVGDLTCEHCQELDPVPERLSYQV